ncbi:hypothetical protein V1478_003870 [Vespula squamosa]|uniref:Uncharacterized protein n=1 Tax=Vespula squamosa TaxID=30214 RepID=A0ABD2BN13_VESSQ
MYNNENQTFSNSFHGAVESAYLQAHAIEQDQQQRSKVGPNDSDGRDRGGIFIEKTNGPGMNWSSGTRTTTILLGSFQTGNLSPVHRHGDINSVNAVIRAQSEIPSVY